MLKLRKNKGLTLVEIIITFSVISVLLMASTKAFTQYFKANIRTNQMAIKTALATERLEEWKSVKGENFLPGVSFPLYSPQVNSSTGVITFTRNVISIPAVTQLEVDCTGNSTTTQNTGYSYTLLQGGFANPGWGASSNCWVDPVTRSSGNTAPGNIKFVINCPAGITATLGMQMVDYATLARNERVVINNFVKGSYIDSDLVPPDGKTISLPLTSIDTGTGHVTVEIEQTGIINSSDYLAIDTCSSNSGWTVSSGSRTAINTISTIIPYTETDTPGKCLSIRSTLATSPKTAVKSLNTSAAVAGDTFSAWVYLSVDQQAWFTLPSGNSNTCTSAVTGWQKLSRVMTAADIGNSKSFTLKFKEISTADTEIIFLNQIGTEKATPSNPNAVLTNFNLISLNGFTDPDSTSGSPVTIASHPGYIIDSVIFPTDTTAGQAVGWTVTITVSMVNDKYKPVVLSNTINR
ncbi:MAG: prepilin-type N-terminal cleavage/methylation domain-containing protein [Candidatus Firestonebacteria bacterium]